MSDVKRYNMDTDKFGAVRSYESEHGRWAKHSDYATLEAECDTLRAELAALKAPAPAQDERDAAYDLIDRHLRQSLDDEAYAEYSKALDGVYATRPAQTEQQPIYQVSNGVEAWEDVDRVRYSACQLDPDEYYTRIVYASPIAHPHADTRGVAMLVAEAAFKAGAGQDRAVASDTLRNIVSSVFDQVGMQTPADGLVGALEHARHFIRNGVALGYIKMPDAGTPDPAHDTLPKIEAALVAHRAGGA